MRDSSSLEPGRLRPASAATRCHVPQRRRRTVGGGPRAGSGPSRSSELVLQPASQPAATAGWAAAPSCGSWGGLASRRRQGSLNARQLPQNGPHSMRKRCSIHMVDSMIPHGPPDHSEPQLPTKHRAWPRPGYRTVRCRRRGAGVYDSQSDFPNLYTTFQMVTYNSPN